MSDRLGGLRIIQWLDRKRWQSTDLSWHFVSGLNFEERVLTHWLTYITDRQMPASEVWHNGASLFANWVKAYSRERSFHASKYYTKRDGFRWREKSFKSRYPKKDLYSIRRTFKVLRSFDKSLVCYVGEVLTTYSGEADVVSRIACALFLLTYDMGYSSRQVATILNGRFEDYYQRWQQHGATNKKRLWASFRDYVKVGSPGRDYFLQTLKKRRYPKRIVRLYARFGLELKFLNQLELPGDVWNNNRIFVTNFLRPLGRQLNIRISEQDAEEGTVNQRVREICDIAQQRGYEIYPEQFDVTYDFVPSMCANPDNATANLCRAICPFGTGDRFLLTYHPESKYCLTSALLTGTLSACTASEHDLFRNGIGRKTCQGYRRRRLIE